MVLFTRYSSRLASLALPAVVVLFATACSTTVPIDFSAPPPCGPGQAGFTLQASGGETELLIGSAVVIALVAWAVLSRVKNFGGKPQA